MSAAVAAAPAAAGGPLSLPRPSLVRLAHVELRKMTDTRSGFWLILVMVLLTGAAAVARGALGDADERTFREVLSVAQVPTAVLLPVLGILAVTSEWSQRTALTTFTLTTRRARIVAAKLLASLALCVAAAALCFACAVVGNLLGIAVWDANGSWSLPAEAVLDAVLLQAIGMVGGLAFGMVFLASAPAIVLYFVLPTAWGILGELVAALDDAGRWLDLGRTTSPLSEFDMSGTAWARLGTSVLLWVVLPFAIGLWRIVRREVS
jgi:ABC-2 type transport system permease protein